jgi:hypothetical protein
MRVSDVSIAIVDTARTEGRTYDDACAADE